MMCAIWNLQSPLCKVCSMQSAYAMLVFVLCALPNAISKCALPRPTVLFHPHWQTHTTKSCRTFRNYCSTHQDGTGHKAQVQGEGFKSSRWPCFHQLLENCSWPPVRGNECKSRSRQKEDMQYIVHCMHIALCTLLTACTLHIAHVLLGSSSLNTFLKHCSWRIPQCAVCYLKNFSAFTKYRL